MAWLMRIFPFLVWFRGYDRARLRHDLVAGVTVALVLIPQSMAYAQLAGLPGHYGLYAAFLPPMVAALFGSSRQLATGPVAVVSLMTAASLEPLATAGGPQYIAYAILLAFIVGAFQFALGLTRLGVLVNFLSHPVVNGFTNAAAIIIATSQLSKVFGVTVEKADHHYETVYRVVLAAIDYTHWPSFGLATLAFGVMWGLRRLNPRIPNVLVAVVLCTLISWATGFKHDRTAALSEVRAPRLQTLVKDYNGTLDGIERHTQARNEVGKKIDTHEKKHGKHTMAWLELHQVFEQHQYRLTQLKAKAGVLRDKLRAITLAGVKQGDVHLYYPRGDVPKGASSDGRSWRLVVRTDKLDTEHLTLRGGGSVVGKVPSGLPSLSLPSLDFDVILKLLPAAIIISLLGFMEAISIAKAMAVRTGQRLDPNQELIGQGLANILGSFGGSYAVSGSFSRSAVNIQAGALTGLASVFTSGVVVITLLFLTPLLFHLPQAVLAAVIMMAVIGLINVRGFVHAWHANRFDGAISVVSFAATLVFAPHLDVGIMVGVALSLLIYLRNVMRPHVACLALHPDGSLRDADRHKLPRCKHMAIIRVDGALFFANANYLEEKVLGAATSMSELRHVLIVANGINDIDASGEEILGKLVGRLRETGLEISFSGMKTQVMDTLRRTGLLDKIGEDHFYPTQIQALARLHHRAHRDSDEDPCPLEKAGTGATSRPVGS